MSSLQKRRRTLKTFAVVSSSVCTGVVDDGVSEGCPGEKADALELSVDTEA
jgi:hypothetical protein